MQGKEAVSKLFAMTLIFLFISLYISYFFMIVVIFRMEEEEDIDDQQNMARPTRKMLHLQLTDFSGRKG